jgi:hypothetical protein
MCPDTREQLHSAFIAATRQDRAQLAPAVSKPFGSRKSRPAPTICIALAAQQQDHNTDVVTTISGVAGSMQNLSFAIAA